MSFLKLQDLIDRKIIGPDTKWNCEHGISNTIPCPTCFRFSEGRDLRDRLRDWQAIWEESV